MFPISSSPPPLTNILILFSFGTHPCTPYWIYETFDVMGSTSQNAFLFSVRLCAANCVWHLKNNWGREGTIDLSEEKVILPWSTNLHLTSFFCSVHIFLGKLIPDILKSILNSLSYRVGFPHGSDSKGMATHSSILAWRIPWTEEPGGLQFMVSQRVRHDWTTNTFTFLEGKLTIYKVLFIHSFTACYELIIIFFLLLPWTILSLKLAAFNKYKPSLPPWRWCILLMNKNEAGLFSSVQSLSHVWHFAAPRITARHASLSITNSCSLPKLMSIKLVMPSNHLILCHPLLLLPSIFPSIRVVSDVCIM